MAAHKIIVAIFVAAVFFLVVVSFSREGGEIGDFEKLVDIHNARKLEPQRPPPCFKSNGLPKGHVQDLSHFSHAVENGHGQGNGCPFVDLDRLSSPIVVDLDGVTSLYGETREYSCTSGGNTPNTGQPGQRPISRIPPLSFPSTGTFVGCMMLDPMEMLHIRIQADTFDAVTSLSLVDDNGCHGGLDTQMLSCTQDPDTSLVSYENLHDVSRRACFYVAAEFDDVVCRDSPEVCERKLQLGWLKTSGQHCEMEVNPGYNAIHSVVSSPQPYQKVQLPAECEAICLSEPECDMAVWHEASVNQVWGLVCVTLSRQQVVDAGRWDAQTWVDQVEVTTMVKKCQAP